MKLTQKLIDKIQEAMLHTNLKGEINWKDGDDIEVQIAGTFAKDKFIVIKNISKNPFENAQPHPDLIMRKKNLKTVMSEFIQRHIKEQAEMLTDLGLTSIDELVRQVVPDSILLRGDDKLPEGCE